MNFIITLIRIPLALIALILILPVHAFQFVLETIVQVICLPFAVVFMSRKDLNQSWLARYPRIIRHGYGDYQMPVNLNPNNGCLVLLAIPLILLIRLLFPKRGLLAGIRSLFVWAFADTQTGY